MSRYSVEDIEVRIWAMVVGVLSVILLGSVAAIIYGVLYVEHDMNNISPIDQAFLAILKDIMLLCIGAVGGVAGRKAVQSVAGSVAGETKFGEWTGSGNVKVTKKEIDDA